MKLRGRLKTIKNQLRAPVSPHTGRPPDSHLLSASCCFLPGPESPAARARLHMHSESRGDSGAVSRGCSFVWSSPSCTVPTDSVASAPPASALCHPPWHRMLPFGCQARCCSLGVLQAEKQQQRGAPLCVPSA